VIKCTKMYNPEAYGSVTILPIDSDRQTYHNVPSLTMISQI
jgi:hypothetical protein